MDIYFTAFLGCFEADVLGGDWAKSQVYGDGVLGAGNEVEVELYPRRGDGAGSYTVLPGPAHQRNRLIFHWVHGKPVQKVQQGFKT